ncbi:MAG: hypothetical protein LLG00_03790 [Planctomycetaceae bacterium]|nr:hypothetical protein [Planctomycetaceae bacterium]
MSDSDMRSMFGPVASEGVAGPAVDRLGTEVPSYRGLGGGLCGAAFRAMGSL